MHAKYLIGYKTGKKTKPLSIEFPQIIEFVCKLKKTRYKSFRILDRKLLEKYESIWNKISNIIGKKMKNI